MVKSEKIIMFPKWQKRLEEESMTAMKAQQFEEALDKFNELIRLKVQTLEIYTGKLICLMELEHFDEAQDLCEELMEKQDKDYYAYIHIYVTLLFQTNQYELLMQVVKDETDHGHVPVELKKLFQELFTMSKDMLVEQNKQLYTNYYADLGEMVNQNNHQEQWRIIHKLRKLNIIPNEEIMSLLVNQDVHPMIKSAIFLWAQEQGVTETIQLHKFGAQLTLIPAETESLKNRYIAKIIHTHIQDLEQHNPSIYHVVTELLEQYLIVLYPINPDDKDAEFIAEALVAVGNESFNYFAETKKYSKIVEHYIKEIKACTVLYSSIVCD